MKTTIIVLTTIILLSVTAMAANSPIDKGSALIGGQISFAEYNGELYEDYGIYSNTIWTITPSVGYFFARGIIGGVEVNFLKASRGSLSSTLISFGPILGYYFNTDPFREDVKGSIYPYLKAFFLYGSASSDPENKWSEYTQTSFGGQGGFLIMVSNTVGANFGVRFSNDKTDWDSPTIGSPSVSGTVFQAGVGISTFIY